MGGKSDRENLISSRKITENNIVLFLYLPLILLQMLGGLCWSY